MSHDPFAKPSRRRHSASSGFAAPPKRDVLRVCVDLGLFAAIFVLPFVMGGRQAIGEMALTVIAAFTTSAWLLRQTLRSGEPLRLTGLTPLLLLGIGIVTFQTLVLTPALVNQLSPQIADVLPAWHSGEDALMPGSWTRLSLMPYETLRSLVCVIACAMLFVVTVNRVRSIPDARRLIRAIALAATVMALFGSVQFLWGNGRFYWVYEYPFTHTRDYAKGAFTNPNHFADYLAMALPILLAWFAIHSLSRQQSTARSHDAGLFERIEGTLIVSCLACVSVAILLSQSRGGLLAACIGTLSCMFFLHRVRVLTTRTAGMLAGIVCAALLSLTLFGNHIATLIEANFHEIASADIEQLDRGEGRQKIWQAAIAGIRDYPLVGTGLSSHREVYWTYFDHPDSDAEFTHAENGYLQIALETGGLGIGVVLCCYLVWLTWCLRGIRKAVSPEVGAMLAAIIGVLAINAAHSATDFVWYAPSIMVVVVMLAACASALNRIPQESHDPLDSDAGQHRMTGQDQVTGQGRFHVGWGTAFVGVVLLSGWMIQTKLPAVVAEPHYYEYVRLVHAEDRQTEESDSNAFRRQKYTALLQAARADRYDARLQLYAARAYQSMFELKQAASDNSMSLLQIQDAALASEWESHEEMSDWLNRPGVLGKNRKYLDTARQRSQYALTLCPLQVEGYLVLGELGWIDGTSQEQDDAMLAQALIARPYDPEVHYVAGRMASLQGQEESALAHWKESFHRSPRFQKQITKLLARVWPAAMFVEQFEPETEALVGVVDAYRDSTDVDGYRQIATSLMNQLAEKAEQRKYLDAIRLWSRSYNLAVELGDATAADRAARGAVKADPNQSLARRMLGKWLYRQQQYAEAIEHLEWVVRRNPQDAEATGWLNASRQRQSNGDRHVVIPASHRPG